MGGLEPPEPPPPPIPTPMICDFLYEEIADMFCLFRYGLTARLYVWFFVARIRVIIWTRQYPAENLLLATI